jgi:hypothetical protein
MNNGNNLIHSFNCEGSSQVNFQGLNKREYFASMAMQALLSSEGKGFYSSMELEQISTMSVNAADALLNALEYHRR